MCFETDYWIRDEWTGRYFRSHPQKIEKAALAANTILLREGDLDLNTFYDLLGQEPIPSGTEVGWSGEEIQIVYGAALSGPSAPPCLGEGAPIMFIRFRNEPKSSMRTSVG